jgi:hypothetical protein
MTAPRSPDGRSITERQNDSTHLTRLLAYSHEYRLAQVWRALRVLGTLGLAAVSPVVLVWWPHGADLLAATAAAWLVAGRTALAAFEDTHVAQAARIQELYDTRLFGLQWNTAVAGRPPAPDDISHAASRIKDTSRYLDWYDVDVTGLPWPADVLLCQRQSSIWARRDHRAYGLYLATVGAVWFLVGVGIALARDMTLADYLVRVFLPSAPAYLDAVELARAHKRHAEARQRLEEDIADLWDRRGIDPSMPTVEDCRRVQDGAFALRRTGPRVPNWFYKVRLTRMARATSAGARALREGESH